MAYTQAQIKALVVDAALRWGIDVNIALAQINQESGFNTNRTSPKGAKGLCQFMPATAARFGLSDPFDPVASLDAWGQYMDWLLARYGYDYKLALAGYNAGEGNVDKYHGIPPFSETQNYVRIIMAAAAANPAASVSGLPDVSSAPDTTSGMPDIGTFYVDVKASDSDNPNSVLYLALAVIAGLFVIERL